MRLEIKSLHLQNFKGCKDRKIMFDGNTRVFGSNSAGKSTLFCAWMWLMGGVNEHLVNNPNITPLGESECVSTVEAEIIIDGQPCTISKSQKYKEKLDDSGKNVSSTTNSFMVNGVDKSATAFKADMVERGIDMDSFLMLSHVFAFTADTSKTGREQMRKVLFEMVEGISDVDIASEITLPEVYAKLNAGYKIDEIEQMAKQSLKKINDNYGKSGELIDARIEGLLDGRAEIDIREIPLKEAAAKAKIVQIEENIKALGMPNNNTDVRIAELEGKIRALELKAKEDYYLKRNEHLKAHSELVDKFREAESIINLAIKKKTEAQALVNNDNAVLEKLRTDYEKAFSQEFVSDGKCSLCGQPLPEEMVKDAEKKFNDGKAAVLKDITGQADAINKELERQAIEIADAEETIQKFAPQLETLNAQIEESSNYDLTEPQILDIPEAVALQAEISDLRAKMDNSYVDELNGLNEALGKARAELSETQGAYKVVENNKAIETKIMELRQQKKDVEIQRAEHEKVIYEVECFKKYKNEKLSSEINSKFKVAQFRLHKVLKNGSIEDDCAVLVNGKEMTTQLNQAMQIRAMLDIINGISVFRETWFPIFIDDASLLTQETIDAIDMQNQLIWLFAKDGYKELTIDG